MKQIKRRISILLFNLLILSYGCTHAVAPAVVIGAVTLSYIGGNVKKEYSEPLPTVWETALVVLEDLKVKYEIREYGSSSGRIDGEMIDGKKMVMKFRWESGNSTEVAIRIRPAGNRKTAESIHDRIASAL